MAKNDVAKKTNDTLLGLAFIIGAFFIYMLLRETIFLFIIPCILGISLLFADYYSRKKLKFFYFIIGFIFLIIAFFFPEWIKNDLFTYHREVFGLHNYKNALNNIAALNHKLNFLTFLRVLFVPAIFYGFIGFAIVLFCLFFIPKSASQKLAEANKKPREVEANFKKLEKIGGGWLYGVPLGVDLWDNNEPIILGSGYLNKHTCLVGTTGSGKTVTLFNFIFSAIANEKAFIFIDGKGDLKNIEIIQEAYNTRYEDNSEDKKKIHVITIDGKNGYNPFANGTPSELTDKIISMFDWTEEHYKLTSSRFLQLLINYLQLKEIPLNLANIVKYSDLKKLVELEMQDLRKATPIKEEVNPSFDNIEPSFEVLEETHQQDATEEPQDDKNKKASEIYEKIKNIEIKAIQGLQARIASLAEGDMQEMFSNPDALNLFEAIENKEPVIFSVDSLRYAEQSKALGRLVVNDIKTCVSKHMKNGAKPVGLFFDEFNVFASHEVIDIINKSRSAGFEALLAFQSLSDIDKLNNGEALRRQIIQNCNNLIVQKQNDSKDAEELSKIFGTYETQELTIQEQKDGEAGAGSLRMVNKFCVAPDDIKRLRTGEAFVKIGNGSSKIKIRNCLQ